MSVVFFHAHPDDESIFTGGTLALLADAGFRTSVVIATGNDGPAATVLERRRAEEAARACEILGAGSLHLLGYGDAGSGSGLDPLRASALDRVVDEATERLATILRREGATELVIYDEGGIYAHADHLAVHRVGRRAAAAAGVTTVHEATVDREYLHFVETHLVGHAVEWLVGEDAIAAINRAPLGVSTVEVTTTVDVRATLDRKRAAILAHTSQIPAGSPLWSMDDDTFAAVYGYEWFVRRGPRGRLDVLAA